MGTKKKLKKALEDKRRGLMEEDKVSTDITLAIRYLGNNIIPSYVDLNKYPILAGCVNDYKAVAAEYLK